MRRRKNGQALWFLGTILLWLELASSAAAQNPEIQEDIVGGIPPGVPFKKQLSSAAINKLLGEHVIEMKVFQKTGGLPLQKVLELIRDQLPAKAKTLRFVIDVNSFKTADPDTPAVADTLVKFPPFPKRMSLQMVLRIALSKVSPLPAGPATMWVQRGSITIIPYEVAEAFDLSRSTLNRSYRKRPLAEILDELSDITGVAIILDHRVAEKAQVPITANLGMSLETALRLLTDMADLRFVMVDNIAYVTTPASAKKIKQENVARQARQFEEKMDNPLGVAWTQGRQVGITFRQRPIAKALTDLASVTGWNIVLDRRVANLAQMPVTARFPNEVSAEAILVVLTDIAGLRHVVLEDAVYVTSPANAVVQEKELAKRQAAKAAKKNKDKAK